MAVNESHDWVIAAEDPTFAGLFIAGIAGKPLGDSTNFQGSYLYSVCDGMVPEEKPHGLENSAVLGCICARWADRIGIWWRPIRLYARLGQCVDEWLRPLGSLLGAPRCLGKAPFHRGSPQSLGPHDGVYDEMGSLPVDILGLGTAVQRLRWWAPSVRPAGSNQSRRITLFQRSVSLPRWTGKTMTPSRSQLLNSLVTRAL